MRNDEEENIYSEHVFMAFFKTDRSDMLEKVLKDNWKEERINIVNEIESEKKEETIKTNYAISRYFNNSAKKILYSYDYTSGMLTIDGKMIIR